MCDSKKTWLSDVNEQDAGKIQRTFPDIELGTPQKEFGWNNKPLIGVYRKEKSDDNQ